jgi:hypothetical protein
MYLHQHKHFNNCVRILLDEDLYAQSIRLPKISLRTSLIHEKSKVVCTLRDRFTDIVRHCVKGKGPTI